jgi:hydrogenase maturation protease
MNSGPARCLILACGNTLRADDGVGPWLAEWAEERFRAEAGVQVLSRQQWTPELAEQIAQTAASVIFIDCAADAAPGSLRLAPVEPSSDLPRLLTHHLEASHLLALARDCFNSLPRSAMLLTVGAGTLELSEGFSDAVQAALPHACSLLEDTVTRALSDAETQRV